MHRELLRVTDLRAARKLAARLFGRAQEEQAHPLAELRRALRYRFSEQRTEPETVVTVPTAAPVEPQEPPTAQYGPNRSVDTERERSEQGDVPEQRGGSSASVQVSFGGVHNARFTMRVRTPPARFGSVRWGRSWEASGVRFRELELAKDVTARMNGLESVTLAIRKEPNRALPTVQQQADDCLRRCWIAARAARAEMESRLNCSLSEPVPVGVWKYSLLNSAFGKSAASTGYSASPKPDGTPGLDASPATGTLEESRVELVGPMLAVLRDSSVLLTRLDGVNAKLDASLAFHEREALALETSAARLAPPKPPAALAPLTDPAGAGY